MTNTPNPPATEFDGLTREMLITQILQLRDLISMERESSSKSEEALREAHDHAQEGLKNARTQERQMRATIATQAEEIEALRKRTMRAGCADGHAPIRWEPVEDWETCPLCAALYPEPGR